MNQTNYDISNRRAREFYLTKGKGIIDSPHTYEEYAKLIPGYEQYSNMYRKNSKAPAYLDESHYLQDSSDVNISEHVRYSPVAWHTHEFIEMICVTHGQAMNYMKDRTQSLTTGDICILAPGTVHGIGVFDDTTQVINVLIRTETFQRNFSGIMHENGILAQFFTNALIYRADYPYLLFHTVDHPEILSCIQLCNSEYRSAGLYRNQLINSYLATFFLLLLQYCSNRVETPVSDSHKEEVIFLLQYIQSQYRNASLSELSSLSGYSTRQIQRLIKKATGKTFKENIMTLKLDEAARLLVNTDLTVEEIAIYLNFNDASHFRKAFRSQYAQTPAAYRKAAMIE